MSDKGTGYAREVVITDDGGLHVRPAAQLAQLVKTLGGNLFIDDVSADSATELMAAGFREGQTVTVSSPNPDKRDAVDAIADRIAGGLANARWECGGRAWRNGFDGLTCAPAGSSAQMLTPAGSETTQI